MHNMCVNVALEQFFKSTSSSLLNVNADIVVPSPRVCSTAFEKHCHDACVPRVFGSVLQCSQVTEGGEERRVKG